MEGRNACLIFFCRLSDQTIPLPHFWEHIIGSGHATLALRADWQRQLQRCRAELGGRHVRFHGLLSDDVGTFTIQQDKPLDSFFNFDRIFDFLLSIGMMIENYRSGFLWRLMRDCPEIKKGLRRAGFRGGWLGRNEARVR